MKFFSSSELAEIQERAKLSGVDPETCPTCLSVAIDGERITGRYKYKNKSYSCNCPQQIQLRKLYLLSNIPDQYQRLDFKEFRGPQELINTIEGYIKNWENFRQHGLGLSIFSPKLGVGKSFIVTYLGRELIKKNQKVFFFPFNQYLDAVRYRQENILQKVNEVNILVLDEIIKPHNDQFEGIFSQHFESLIRNRTNYNGTTLLTTNLTPKQLQEHYPRVFSLLEPKSISIELDGEDARQSFISEENLSMALNGETRPII